ncbi:MAG: Arc family DNA-binding protein, partial [Pseudomonadales bacterium]
MDSLKDHQKESTIPAMTDRHQQKPYPLRMPDELRARLEEAAQEGSRSLHAEILSRLESTFSHRVPVDKFVIDKGERVETAP